MKIKSDLLFKSFIISLVIFSLIAAVVITDRYIELNVLEPTQRASNLLIGLTHDGEVLSLTVMHCDPKNNSVTFLPIPDNTLLEGGKVLQDLYYSAPSKDMLRSIQDLIGTSLHRYLFVSTDALVELTDSMGKFEYLIRYPFNYGSIEYKGNIYMDGQLAKAMFTYSDYDMKKVSIATIGESFLQNFLSQHSNNNLNGELAKLVNLNTSLVKTNLTNKEIDKYCEFLSRFSSLSRSSISINGEITAASTNLYFIPKDYKSNKNIFK